ncbi:MAG: hypothetical protein KI793_21405 [Rivularia sp. (in: Bacteria)]|nr:hypothetical protein [Rivularia sp. MS3]
MNYDLQILYETDEAFNCDVITADEEKYMGRLYILTTDDNTLKTLGIKEEWYLAHEEADVLVSGHINSEGKWSLSTWRNLEPSFEYTTRNKIFDQVFSPEYVWKLMHFREENIISISQKASIPDSFNGSDDNNSNGMNRKYLGIMPGQLNITTENLNILQGLIMHSNDSELVALEQDLETEIISVYNEQESAVKSTNINEIMNHFQRESAPLLDEKELFHAQIDLTERIMDEYEKQGKDEFVFTPLGIVTINAEESCCSLKDSEDGHTIFTATFDADIIHGLNDTDALKIEMILHQFDREDFRRARSMLQEEKLIHQDNGSQLNRNAGIDYDS